MTNQINQKKVRSILRKSKLLGILLSLFIIIAVILFFLMQSPILINKFASVFREQIGFKISIGDISLSPDLKGEIRDLDVTALSDKNTAFFVSHADIEGKINKHLQGAIKRAVLKEPKLSLTLLKNDKADLSFLNKLPPVEFLDISKGEVQFLLGTDGQLIKLTDISLNLQDFSPQKGGKLHFKCKIKIKSKNNDHDEGTGHGEGDFHFTRFLPTPIGKGYIRLNITNMSFGHLNFQNFALNMSLEMKTDTVIVHSLSSAGGSVIYKKEDKEIVFRDMQLMPFANYDIKKRKLYAGIKDGMVDALGTFDVTIKSNIKQDYPWKTSLRVSSLNFDKASEILKDFLPSQYKKWSFKGKGVMEATMEGDYKNNRLSGSGKMMLQFKEGGFSSPHGDKAAEGVAGKIIIDIQIPTPAKKGQFDISSETRLGEFLWGKYYKDFGGKKLVFRSSGNLYNDSFKSIDSSGNMDLAEAGKYSYSASMNGSEWIFRLNSEDIYLQEFFSFFMRDYLIQNIPSLSDSQVRGVSRIEMNLYGSGSDFTVNGMLNIKEGHMSIPNHLIVSVDLALPFDFFYPPLHSFSAQYDIRGGNLYIKNFEAASFKIKDLNIPLILSKNTFWLPEEAVIPFSGTTLKLIHFKGENLLSSNRFFTLGMILNDLEIGPHIEKASGVNIPAKFHSELSEITYQNEKLNINGKTRIEIFGGRADIDNIHGRKIFSHSRMIGGDIIFEGINLHELTGYIKLGRMSGIIKGSLSGFEMEYGQPSRFVLDIESVKTKGIAQSVSVDAIENISIMGSGSQGIGVILKSGLNRFFKQYNYSRIGIICILENDVFTIRGKIQEEGKEYLIRKAFLRGIDVINQNPENNISFKDMRERINRVFEKKQDS